MALKAGNHKKLAYKKLKYWFDRELAVLLAEKIIAIYPDFNKEEFTNSVDRKVQGLELKDRVEVISDQFHAYLTNSYPKNIEILKQILGPENPDETGMFTNYYWVMPIAKYVEKYGLNDFETSMDAIVEITKRNTGEYAIRPYLESHTKRTLNVMYKWSLSENFHVRRLSSEGVRPRLPWAKKLNIFVEDPEPILPILNNLKDDPSKYVQKSVANCLNDILKDNPQFGMNIIDKWRNDPTHERRWIIKHSIRNLIKQENDWANKILNDLKNKTDLKS